MGYTGNEEFRKRIQEKLTADRRKEKEKERTQRLASSQYDWRDVRRSSPPPPPRKTDENVRINELTAENQQLKENYSKLLKQANKLITAYRELKTEHEKLMVKKYRKEAASKVFNDVGKSFQNGFNKIILWFKT